MKPAKNREYLGEQFTAIFLGIVVLVLAVLGIDYATGWPIVTAAGDAWAQISPYVRLILIVLAASTLVNFFLFWLIVRTAKPVDENETPIEVKKEGK